MLTVQEFEELVDIKESLLDGSYQAQDAHKLLELMEKCNNDTWLIVCREAQRRIKAKAEGIPF